MKAVVLLLPAIVAAAACRGSDDAPRATGAGHSPSAERATAALPPPASVSAASDTAPTLTEFRHVNFHVGAGTVLRIRSLRGEMRSTTPGQPINFDDKRSFTIHLTSAEVGLTTTDLDHLMNQYVFAYKDAPLRKLRFATKGDQLVQHGTLHKVINMSFEITAALSVTPDGRIRIHPTHIKVLGFLGGGFLKALGLTLQKMLDLRKARGITVQGNDLLLDPASLLPPPAISGRVTAVRVEGNELIQEFGSRASRTDGDAHALATLDSAATNYMRFRGGTLRFGKLFMVNADMQIIDADPSDPFDFSIDEYNRQLVAGYSRNTAAHALEVYMPDLQKVGHQRLTPH
ncbi:MAG TPA: hypothetical protein VFW89_07670 [Gemmatimonadaceae bacterium]|nr:hypothetical protein [Gemmatimonadaceae bacterium]